MFFKDLQTVYLQYQVDGLKQKCIKYLKKKTTVKNAIEQLLLADLFNSEHLKFHFIEFICINADAVIKTKNWKIFKEEFAKTYAHLVVELFEVFAKKY